jgi:3-oxoacyl-[acyl-carrier-protein] synthase-1
MKSMGSIVAVAARTSVGLDALQTAFVLRTGMPALTSSPLASPEGEAVTMAYDATQDPFAIGEERAARVAGAALRELVGAIGVGPAKAMRLRLALAFPEPRLGSSKSAESRALAMAMRSVMLETFGEPHVEVAARGAAGLAYVLPDALDALAEGAVDAVVAGGVHSDYDPESIRVLAETGRLFSQENMDAVAPGEAAAFVLITRDDVAMRLGMPPLARIHAVASETGDMSPHDDGSSFDASALSSAMLAATSVMPEELKVGWLLGDLGFEHYRTREFYAALTRTTKVFGPPLVVESPAQRIGNLGAAAMPLALVVAALGFDRGFAPSPFALAFGGSDGGERGAILVGSP